MCCCSAAEPTAADCVSASSSVDPSVTASTSVSLVPPSGSSSDGAGQSLSSGCCLRHWAVLVCRGACVWQHVRRRTSSMRADCAGTDACRHWFASLCIVGVGAAAVDQKLDATAQGLGWMDKRFGHNRQRVCRWMWLSAPVTHGLRFSPQQICVSSYCFTTRPKVSKNW